MIHVMRSRHILSACCEYKSWMSACTYNRMLILNMKTFGFTKITGPQCTSTVNFSNAERNNITQQKQNKSSLSKFGSQGELTVGEKVKQTTKDASYLTVIIAGVTITGLMLYAILRELLSKKSPSSVYSEALKLCRNHAQVSSVLGEPMKGYGETTTRGRRRHVRHIEYIKDGVNCMKMQFYIEGPHKKGTVHVDVRENDARKYEYRYLFVDIETYPRQTIIVEDNR